MSLQNQSQNYSGDGGGSTSSSGPFADHGSIAVGTTTTDGYLTAIAGGRAEFLSPADVLKQVKLGTDRCSGGGFDPASYWVKPEHSYHPQHPHWGFTGDHVPSTTATGSGAMAAAATTAGLIGIGGFGAGEPLQATTGYNTGLFVPSIPNVPVPSDGISVQHSERTTQSGGGSSDQGPFQCPHCARTFSRRQNLTMHVTWQHGDGPSPSSSEQRSFRCEIEGCGKTFRRRNNLTQHSKLHHQPQTASLSQQTQQQQQPPPPTGPPFNPASKPANSSHFGCLDGIYTGRSLVSQQLPGGFTTNVTFNYGGIPTSTNHSSNPEAVATGTSSTSNSTNSSGTTNITSNKNSNSNGGCNGEVNLNSSTAGGKRSGWNRHARRGASEVSPEDVASGAAATVYECPHCSRSFTKRQSLGLHITWSHNPDGKAERTFLCERPGCEKAFRRKSSLAQHLKFHDGLKTEICPTCGKGFVHRYELNRHRKYHPQDTSASSSDANGGNPRHICSGCGQAFNRGAQLTIHRRTHPSCCPSTPPAIQPTNFNHHIEPDSLQAPRTEPSPISNVAIITPLPTTTATTTTTTTTTTTALPYQQVHPSSNLPSQATTATSFSPHFHHLQQKENSTSLQRSNQPLQAPSNMRNPPTGLLQHPYVSLPTVPTAPAAGGFAFNMSSAHHHNNHATQSVNHIAHESLIGNVAAALLDKALDKAVAAAGCLPPAQQQHLLQVSMMGALHGDSESPNVHSASSERESPNHHSMDTLLSNASSESQSVHHSSNTGATEIHNTEATTLQHASNVVSQGNSGYSPLEWQSSIDHRNLAPKSAEVGCIKAGPEVHALTSKDNVSDTDEKESFQREHRETVKEQKKAIWRRIMVRCRKQKQVFHKIKRWRLHSHNHQSCVARKEHCNTCGIQLSTKGMLILHLRWLHLDTRPWTCQKCNKKFVCSGAMLQHAIALHQQSSSAICPRCGCNRGEMAALAKHNKLCRMNRQYTLRTEFSKLSTNILHRCRTCSRSFHNITSLKKHKRLREGTKECPICKKRFHTCNGVEVHREIAHVLSTVNGIVTQKRKIGMKGVKRHNRLAANGSAKTYESGNNCGHHQEDSSAYTLAGLSR